MEELKLGEFWQECLTKLTEILDENIVHKWIKPLKPLGFSEDDTVIKLEAPTELKKKLGAILLRKHYQRCHFRNS